jgi:hypothetical protein
VLLPAAWVADEWTQTIDTRIARNATMVFGKVECIEIPFRWLFSRKKVSSAHGMGQ